jgi:DNA topoisomerase-1
MKYLVIVESPAKKNKIQQFLNTIKGHSFIVEASFGHIRYFANGLKSIDTKNDFIPTYSVTKDKSKVVKNLKQLKKKVDDVVIATDLDREGEAIGFHIADVLNLSLNDTKRICFNEITKNAVVNAFKNSRNLDHNLFHAQQTRSILDLLIGFEISPLLWSSIQPKLSAGRCQTPALRLIHEREKKIEDFKSNKSFQLTGIFNIYQKIETNYTKELLDKNKVKSLIQKLIDHQFKLVNITDKISKQNPPAPYITSTIQQDASSRFSMSPSLTMSVLQKLYEKGKITYMRTDSTAISDNFMEKIIEFLDINYAGYFKKRQFKSKVSNAQEAHECIRPVSLDDLPEDYPNNEIKLFNMIRQRVIASQMRHYSEKNFTYTLESIQSKVHRFTFTLTKVIDEGFKVIYNSQTESNDDLIKKIKVGQTYEPLQLIATEKNTKPIARYTEASLIKELENKGIGRPSTFASIVGKLFERKYAIKKSNHNYKDIILDIISIKSGDTSVKEEQKQTKSVSEKNKIFITDIGKLVNEYLETHFNDICQYNFTAKMESDLDKIADNKVNWVKVTRNVYDTFHPTVIKLKGDTELKKSYKDKKTNLLGKYKGKNVYTYVGRFGPCIQYGEKDNNPKYVSINIDEFEDISAITLKQATELLKFPKELGTYNNSIVNLNKGPYGYYIDYNKRKFSVEHGKITLAEAKEIIKSTKSNIIKEFSDISVRNGPYGPYIKKGSKFTPIPKDIDPKKLTKKECLDIIKNYVPAKFSKGKGKK